MQLATVPRDTPGDNAIAGNGAVRGGEGRRGRAYMDEEAEATHDTSSMEVFARSLLARDHVDHLDASMRQIYTFRKENVRSI